MWRMDLVIPILDYSRQAHGYATKAIRIFTESSRACKKTERWDYSMQREKPKDYKKEKKKEEQEKSKKKGQETKTANKNKKATGNKKAKAGNYVREKTKQRATHPASGTLPVKHRPQLALPLSLIRFTPQRKPTR